MLRTAGGSGHMRYTSALSGQPEIAGYAPVPGNDWVLAVTQPRAAFEAPVQQLHSQMWWSASLVGLLFVGLALRFARGIVRPMRDITDDDSADAADGADSPEHHLYDFLSWLLDWTVRSLSPT